MNAVITQLCLYPVKGCRGLSLSEACLTPLGLMYEGVSDREWMMVDAQGHFLSQRGLPRMALIDVQVSPQGLVLSAPGMPPLTLDADHVGATVSVQVWGDTLTACTLNEYADTWCTEFLGQYARMVRFDPQATRLASKQYTGSLNVQYRFADAFPLLMTNEASLFDLNQKLSTPVTMARFRPNIVLKGIEAFEEDFVRCLTVGEARIDFVKHCARCSVPGVDPESGLASNGVPDTLATYRRTDQGVLFGVNGIVASGAGSRLQVGDSVHLEWAFDT